MKNRLRWTYVVLLVGFIAFIASCSSNETRTATVQVRLTDSPGDFEEVNIDIQDVQVNSDSSSGGWKSLSDVKKGVYDLLKLTNGLDTLLGDIQLPAGKISQVRLVLGDNNSVKVSGQSFPLKTPSAQQSGLKIQVHTTLTAGITYKITLDFDAARSIVTTGNGSFNLKPVIRSIVAAEGGGIKGMVTPAASTPAVYAISGAGTADADTVSTNADQLTGKFLFSGIAPGTYVVSFVPKSGYLTPPDKTGVNVVVGTVTDIGTITIEPQ